VAERDDYLVDMLVDLGFVTAQQVAALRAEAQSSGVGVVDLMLANKIIRSADVTQAKAAHFGAEVVNLSEMRIEDDVIASIPRHIAKKYRVVPVFKHDNNLTVALADPSDLDTLDSLTHLLRADIDLRVASEDDIEAALNKYYGADKKGSEDSRFKDVIQELTEGGG
jgi:type IV pilus assembly protein PilB